MPFECLFANKKLNTVFFHDQLFANIHRQRGMLSALIVVSAAVLFDTETEVKCSTKEVIRTTDGKLF